MGKHLSDLTKSVIFSIKTGMAKPYQIKSRLKWADPNRVIAAITKLRNAGKIRAMGCGRNVKYEIVEDS